MAERRMFAKTIIDSDAFLDMPATAQLLYFHLSMRADDDGFINKPRSIMRICGAKDDDMKILLAKKFVLPFDSGIVVIKHWKIHNYIQRDRYKPTVYTHEKAMLETDEINGYRLAPRSDTSCIQSGDSMDTECIQGVSTLETQVRLGKDKAIDSLVYGGVNATDQPQKARFKAPSAEEVQAYCRERGNNVDPQRFVDYYSSNGWMVGRNHMKDWKAAVRSWEKNSGGSTSGSQNRKQPIYGSGELGEAELYAIKQMMGGNT